MFVVQRNISVYTIDIQLETERRIMMSNEIENMKCNAYAYMPEHPTPFITRKKVLPHRKPSEGYIEIRKFFSSHDFVETINQETGEMEFVAIPKR